MKQAKPFMNEVHVQDIQIDTSALRGLCRDEASYGELLATARESLLLQQAKLGAQNTAPTNHEDFFHRLLSVLSYLLSPNDLAGIKALLTVEKQTDWPKTKELLIELLEDLLKQVNYLIDTSAYPRTYETQDRNH